MFAIIYLILYPNETPIHGRILNTSCAIYQLLLQLNLMVNMSSTCFKNSHGNQKILKNVEVTKRNIRTMVNIKDCLYRIDTEACMSRGFCGLLLPTPNLIFRQSLSIICRELSSWVNYDFLTEI